MKERLVEAESECLRRIESGDHIVVGVNRWTGSVPSPLVDNDDGGILKVNDAAERSQVESLIVFRQARDHSLVTSALNDLESAIRNGHNLMEPSIAAAHAGVTTGEWSAVLRKAHGEWRAPTGIVVSSDPPPALACANRPAARSSRR